MNLKNQSHIISGFTLVETLVVFSIIAILASILVPAVMGAYESSRNTGCSNNQKQIGVALTLYQQSNEGFFPFSNLRDNSNAMTITDRLGNYDGRALTEAQQTADSLPDTAGTRGGIYFCPNDTVPRNEPNVQYRSYSFNGVEFNPLDKSVQHTARGVIGVAWNAIYNKHSLRISYLTRPSSSLVMVDAPTEDLVLGRISENSSSPTPISRQTVIPMLFDDPSWIQFINKPNLWNHGFPIFNVLYADGHVNQRSYYETYQLPDGTQGTQGAFWGSEWDSFK